ncbi:MAG: DUF2950 family protein [Planctomycetes bacterium]|nr:DUF2950 family protein [Planctomycetota bacterium]
MQLRRADGFTLIELLIVVAIIAIIASIAVPSLLRSRSSANEAAAIATLKSLVSTQAQIRTMAAIDANRNGAGEHGFFAEMAGSVAPRIDESGNVGTAPVVPLMMPAFGQLTNGAVARAGYHFRMFLPAVGTGAPTGEAATGGAVGLNIDARLAETQWCAYAWPSSYGISGHRAFFINQGGDILATENSVQRYNGNATPVTGNAAFANGAPNAMGSATAANTVGNDGGRWVVVN